MLKVTNEICIFNSQYTAGSSAPKYKSIKKKKNKTWNSSW